MGNIVPDWIRKPVQRISQAMTGTGSDHDETAVDDVRPRVLCVDDNPKVLKLLKRQLGVRYDLHIAQTAHDALALIASAGPFDAIISDLRMPDVHGLTFLKKAREVAPTTPRIILTGLPDPTTMSVARSAGAAESLIVKPWTREELIQAVDSAVQRRRDQAAAV
ncbi:MAG: response regulator [Gemmatimonadota bacterium]